MWYKMFGIKIIYFVEKVLGFPLGVQYWLKCDISTVICTVVIFQAEYWDLLNLWHIYTHTKVQRSGWLLNQVLCCAGQSALSRWVPLNVTVTITPGQGSTFSLSSGSNWSHSPRCTTTTIATTMSMLSPSLCSIGTMCLFWVIILCPYLDEFHENTVSVSTNLVQ